jgi:hypothetical protein
VKSLRQRSASEGLRVHACIAPRVYEEDSVQKDRIERSRKMLSASIGGRKGLRVVELGCGTMDITGPFSQGQIVYGVECNQEAVEIAARRWPNAHLNVFSLDPESCDVLVCCEFLEHIENPSELIARWLPLAKRCVISHPLDGDISGDLSAGEHQWSFSKEDFENWFRIGGHQLVEHDVFNMGGYQIILGRGERLG